MGRESSDVRNVFAKATSAIVSGSSIVLGRQVFPRCPRVYKKHPDQCATGLTAFSTL